MTGMMGFARLCDPQIKHHQWTQSRFHSGSPA